MPPRIGMISDIRHPFLIRFAGAKTVAQVVDGDVISRHTIRAVLEVLSVTGP